MHTLFVIFGATGDLAKRKLFPALQEIYQDGKKGNFEMIGVGRRDFDSEGFRAFVAQETQEFLKQDEDFGKFLSLIHYAQLELGDVKSYSNLQKVYQSLKKPDTQVILYLAISPEFFIDFIEGYKTLAFSNVKVVFEKPFGTDLASASALNETIGEVFDESLVYRIDHYVGKESIQNILALRFTNPIFESIWNARYIDNIQITASETLGVGNRGEYYDRFGALRDMLQNHLFQVLSLVVMSAPAKLDDDAIRHEKYKVFRAITLPSDFANHVVFGQYEGYLSEKGVSPNSKTETFVAMKLEVASWHFAGVPIYLRTGKNLKKKSSRIVIELKKIPKVLFNEHGEIKKNRIILEIQPDERISIEFNIKHGDQKRVKQVTSSFENHLVSKEAYQKLLEDVMVGDKTLFTSWEMLRESWRIVDELVNCKENCPIVFPYQKGTDGPEASVSLLASDNRVWYEGDLS